MINIVIIIHLLSSKANAFDCDVTLMKRVVDCPQTNSAWLLSLLNKDNNH